MGRNKKRSSRRKPKRPAGKPPPRKKSVLPGSRLLQSITLATVLLFLMVVVAYVPALRAAFVWDDDAVTENMLLRATRGIWDIWAHPSGIPHEAHYWPFVYSSFWLDYRVWSLNPFGYHLTNVLLHALNTLLLWLLLRRLTIPGAWLAAAIFALHPVHVESVAWVIERKDVLSTMFYLLTFLTYVRFTRSRKWGSYGLALFLYLCAMLSKSMTVSLPLAVILWLWWKQGRLEKRDLLPLLPFFAIAAAIAAFDVRFAQHYSDVTLGLSFLDKFLIAGRAIWFYAWKLLWPANLVANYPKWQIDPGTWWQYLFPLAVAAVLLALWILRKRWGRGPLATALYFTITLGPVLGFIEFSFMDMSYVADRFQYLPSIGLIVLFAALITRAAQRLREPNRWLFYTGSGVLLLGLGFLTWQQAGVYKNNETLFGYNLAKNPKAWLAYDMMGNVFVEKNNYDQAIAHYSEAIRLKPDYAEAYNNLGVAYAELGQLDKAMELYTVTLKNKPKNPKAHNNFANALFMKGQLDEAIEHYEKAIELNPYYWDAHSNLGVALAQQGKHEEAIAHHRRALEIHPTYAPALYNLANVLSDQGKVEEAIAYYQKALQANPNYVEVYNNLANMLYRVGRIDEAIAAYTQALKLRPNFTLAHSNLARIYEEQAKFAQAITHFREVVRLSPEWLEPANRLAWLLATAPEAGLREGEEAVRLAERINERTGNSSPVFLDTLAAAYAELGQFNQAVATVTRALEMARTIKEHELASQLEQRLQLYKSGNPFRQQPLPRTP